MTPQSSEHQKPEGADSNKTLINSGSPDNIAASQRDIEKNAVYSRIQSRLAQSDLALVMMNDSQGLNLSPRPGTEGLFDQLKSALRSKDPSHANKEDFFDASSALFNKTDHVDDLLRSNLSLAEVKLLQKFGAEQAFTKGIEDFLSGKLGNSFFKIFSRFGITKWLGKLTASYMFERQYQIQSDDWTRNISDVIRGYTDRIVQESSPENPPKNSQKNTIFVYTSGPNDIMQKIGTNPLKLPDDYKNRDTRDDWNYAVEKAKNPDTIQSTINGVRKNIRHILSLNPNVQVFVLGAYFPSGLASNEYKVFHDLTIAYNEELKKLAQEFQIDFIETMDISSDSQDFHIGPDGQRVITDRIIAGIDRNLNQPRPIRKALPDENFRVEGGGLNAMSDAVWKRYQKASKQAGEPLTDNSSLREYSKQRDREIAAEEQRNYSALQNAIEEQKNLQK